MTSMASGDEVECRADRAHEGIGHALFQMLSWNSRSVGGGKPHEADQLTLHIKWR
jgi:hypothetical protein